MESEYHSVLFYTTILYRDTFMEFVMIYGQYSINVIFKHLHGFQILSRFSCISYMVLHDPSERTTDGIMGHPTSVLLTLNIQVTSQKLENVHPMFSSFHETLSLAICC